jgi:hypothetical protein
MPPKTARMCRTALTMSPDAAEDRPHVPDGVDDVAGAGLALGPEHRRALRHPAERLAQVAAAAHERDGGVPLVDVVRLIRRGEDLALVDVVDVERLQDLCFDEMADPALGHDRDGHRVPDRLDSGRVGHPDHATLGADVGGDAFQGHDRDRAGVLGHLGLFGVGDVHDHPALQHLGEAALHPHRSQLDHRQPPLLH